MIYKILWIDDLHHKFNKFKSLAKENEIELICCKSLEKGWEILKNNTDDIDGILLDARFYKEEDDVPGTEDTEYLYEFMQRLYKLHKFYDPCVYTGQSDININSEFSKFFKGNVFYKDNINELFTYCRSKETLNYSIM